MLNDKQSAICCEEVDKETSMNISSWYKLVLVLWLVLGLPPLVIGFGMAGASFSTPDFQNVQPEEVVAWVFTCAWLLAPIVLAPFGIRLKDTRK